MCKIGTFYQKGFNILLLSFGKNNDKNAAFNYWIMTATNSSKSEGNALKILSIGACIAKNDYLCGI